jgi:hypothetical protein
MTRLLVFAVAIVALVSQEAPQEQTLTGCLRTGGAANVFLLRGAAADQNAETPSGTAVARAEDYLLVAIPADAALNERVNHRIAVTGVVSDPGAPPPPPAGANAAEKALKKLSVKSVREVAANCAAGR